MGPLRRSATTLIAAIRSGAVNFPHGRPGRPYGCRKPLQHRAARFGLPVRGGRLRCQLGTSSSCTGAAESSDGAGLPRLRRQGHERAGSRDGEVCREHRDDDRRDLQRADEGAEQDQREGAATSAPGRAANIAVNARPSGSPGISTWAVTPARARRGTQQHHGDRWPRRPRTRGSSRTRPRLTDGAERRRRSWITVVS